MTEIQTPQTEAELKKLVDDLLREVRHERDQWEGAFAKLRELFASAPKDAVLHVVEGAARRERLELQWKLEELIEEFAPPPPPKKEEPPAEEPEPEPEPEPEEEVPADMGPLRPEDLEIIYDDPRGIVIHEHKTQGFWLLTQIDPMSGQPQTVQLAGDQKTQVKAQLLGSPYWKNQ